MNLVVAIYSALLFFVLTPGVFLRLPKNGSKFLVTGVHGLLFAVILYFTSGYVWRLSHSFGSMGMKKEGLEMNDSGKKADKKGNKESSMDDSSMGDSDKFLKDMMNDKKM
jgi:hypothetical protein